MAVMASTVTPSIFRLNFSAPAFYRWEIARRAKLEDNAQLHCACCRGSDGEYDDVSRYLDEQNL